ncbi:hypothetical protein FH972_019463 [Carpinus fangiana]|uniref:Uncharacterized protein n=1 Tax=Carpinus fangiana TaxID=176857 RepID=A0A5N6RQ78_9ROSI|nr:hypothetical protein FH972_019463 [Carpinus fangiana]
MAAQDLKANLLGHHHRRLHRCGDFPDPQGRVQAKLRPPGCHQFSPSLSPFSTKTCLRSSASTARSRAF